MPAAGVLRRILASSAKVLLYFVGLAAFSALWLAALLAGGIVVYRSWFGFDAADLAQWAGVYQSFLAGGTVPFDFVAVAVGLTLGGLLGGAALAFRLPAIADWLVHSRLAGAVLGLALSGVPRFPHRLPALARKRMGGAGARLVGAVARCAEWASRRVKKLSVSGTGTPAGARREAAEALGVSALPKRRHGGRRHRILYGSSRAPGAAEAAPCPEDGVSPQPSSVPLPGRASLAEELPSADELAAVASPSDEAPAVDDDVAIGRAMALFDVWVDPPPTWMEEALAEELAGLSAAGWARLLSFGKPGVQLLLLAASRGILPAEADRQAAARAALAEVERGAAGEEQGEQSLAEADWPSGEDPSVVGEAGEPPAMSLCAGWLCELLDNYVALEDKRGADDFESRWGSLFRQTGDHLRQAMSAMTEEDWASLDRFPHRAGRARVLTDRLREDFRVHREAEKPGGAPETVPESPFAVTDAEPGEARAAGRDDARAEMLSLLERSGFRVRSLAGADDSKPAEDFVAESSELSVVLRLQPLGDRQWRLAAGGLGPWSAEGRIQPSPCRSLWQRLTLMRAMGREGRPMVGLVVVAWGELSDEAAVAAAVREDWRRTGVDLVWLQGEGRPLSSLEAKLNELRGGAAARPTDARVPAQ